MGIAGLLDVEGGLSRGDENRRLFFCETAKERPPGVV